MPTNILTIDVEDWYQLSGEQLRGRGEPQPEALARQIERVLELLDRHRTRATFFCLGKSLLHAPDLILRIADAGHEIASHGWGHEPIFRIGLERFRADLQQSLDWLGGVLGRPVGGYRAPAFSVAREQLDRFYDICFECGLTYDSSVFPIRGRRYGIPDAPRTPHLVRERGGRKLIELPLATLQLGAARKPVAGGGYWRITRGGVIRRAVKQLNSEGLPAVTYLHPYEFDVGRLSAPRAAGWSVRSMVHGFKQNLGRGSMYGKLDRLLSQARFGAAEDYLRDAGYL